MLLRGTGVFTLALLCLLLPGVSLFAKDKCEEVKAKITILNWGFTKGVFIENGQSVSRRQTWWNVRVEGYEKPVRLYSMPSKWGIYGSGDSALPTSPSFQQFRARVVGGNSRNSRKLPVWQVCDESGRKQTFGVVPSLSTDSAIKSESFVCPIEGGTCTKLDD